VQVVVLLLLVVALAFLVLGLIAGSTPLVLASIVASLVAAYAIVRFRRRQELTAGKPAVPATAEDPAVADVVPATTVALPTAVRATAVAVPAVAVPAVPAAAGGAHARVRGAHARVRGASSATPAGTLVTAPDLEPAPPVAASDVTTAEVRTAEVTTSGAEPEPPVDDLADEPAVADTDPPLRSRGNASVWVIDGRPRYHLAGCAFIVGRRPEPVTLRQAFEDGFTPCVGCDPDRGLAAG